MTRLTLFAMVVLLSAGLGIAQPTPSSPKLRIIAFGAHPDDAEFKVGGTAILWARQGHHVKLVSVTNGDIGHWQSAGGPLAQRRRAESAAAAKVMGVESQVLDLHDGELLPTLENRKLITRVIREWNADLVIAHRPWDYHPDHRYVGVLVQDAAFMVTVPYFCPDVPYLKKNPVFMYCSDRFKKPYPFHPDIAISLDEVFESKLDALHELRSQVYEGGASGNEDFVREVPPERDEAGRKAWLRTKWEARQSAEAHQYRDLLRKFYGEERGNQVKYAEAFEVCEYGRQPTEGELKELFPFFGDALGRSQIKPSPKIRFAANSSLRAIPLKSTISSVQPMTGIVLWNTNPMAATSPIQLEFSYLKFDQIVREEGKFDWEPVEKLLSDVAGRKHQAILRWHDTYVGEPSGVPAYIKSRSDYRETAGISEKKMTGFPDWSNRTWQDFVLDFFSEFAKKYDRDPRLAFLQVGFGLWAEYHIYDGPMDLGKTFPNKEFQSKFVQHLARSFRETPWMISVDAAGDHAPFAGNQALLRIPFGVFDDSFNHARHKQENEPNWEILNRQRWQIAPVGGEFSFFKPKDQKGALSPKGPYGIPFEDHAAKFHLSFIIGDNQPKYQKPERILAAGQACGYRFQITRFYSSPSRSEVTVENRGIAPFYYDAFPAIDGIRSKTSLKGLLPGETRQFQIPLGGDRPVLTIESDRLVAGQRIEFAADLSEDH